VTEEPTSKPDYYRQTDWNADLRVCGEWSVIVRFTASGGSGESAGIEAPRKLVMTRKFEKHLLQGARTRRDLLLFIALAIALFFPLPGLAQSTTSALIAKLPHIDIKTLTHKANSGNPEAQFELGLAYEKGLGVDKSQSEAMRWYRSAAKSGDTRAQYKLAYLYETGPDGIKDIGEAVKWYKRAEQGRADEKVRSQPPPR